MGKYTQKKLFLDESRIWNIETSTMKHDRVRSYLLPYFWYDVNTEYLVGIKNYIRRFHEIKHTTKKMVP